MNRRTFAGYADDAGTYQSTINYTYDSGNRLTKAVDSKAGTFTRSWDLMNRVISDQGPNGTVTYAYDAAGRRTSMVAGNQAQANYTWDNADRLVSLSQGTVAVGISYDAAGLKTAISLPNSVSENYSYDADSRVTSISYSAGGSSLGNLTYAYDPDGRRTQSGGSLAATVLPSAVSYTYNGDNYNSPASEDGTYGFANDASGDLYSDLWGYTNYTGGGLTWNARGELRQLYSTDLGTSYGSGGYSTVYDETENFVYDPFGRRIQAQVAASRTTTSKYLYDGSNIVQEQFSGGDVNLLNGLVGDVLKSVEIEVAAILARSQDRVGIRGGRRREEDWQEQR